MQITSWFGRGSGWNLAIAIGAPGPDVLDIDQHGPAGNGYPAFTQLQQAGLATSAAAYIRTPAGGMHAYFTGSHQHNGHLASHHLDLRSHGGYVLAPPFAAACYATYRVGISYWERTGEARGQVRRNSSH